MPLLAGLVLLLAIGGAGAAWHVLRSPSTTPPGTAAEDKPGAKPFFVPLDPFTVNLAEEAGDHYLQVGIVYQIVDEQVGEKMKTYMPVLRNRLLLLLSAKRPTEIVTAEGKQKLVEELVAAARESLPGERPDKGVTSALLASFVIQ